jgi:2-polyprenyl-6-methoxyphenol hydroxylase-like FAD-dependent oxidoreductase
LEAALLQVDVAIAGGGLAGSLAAAMLGRAGIRVALVDPHRSYPPDFRCEKIDGSQVEILRRTGLADAVLSAGTLDREAWFARSGRVIDKRRSGQYGILYQDLVNTVRAQIPSHVNVAYCKVKSISLSDDRQHLALSDGSVITARLIILANGLNSALRHNLGMERHDVSPGHSVAIGFDVKPLDCPAFATRAITYYFERPEDRIAYLTMFPVGTTWRANLMTYRDARDPWLHAFRHEPQSGLASVMTGLASCIGRFEVSGPVKIRPADLYVTGNYLKSGIVLVGDAFATSCPAAGTGLNKVFTDVERLCSMHIPHWLATAGMGPEKLAAFYRDPVKVACDTHSFKKAFYLRSFSSSTSWPWTMRRAAHSLVRCGRGVLKRSEFPKAALGT